MSKCIWIVVLFAGCSISTDRTKDSNSIIQSQIDKVAAGEQTGVLLYESKNTDRILKVIADQAPNVEGICISFTDVTSDGIKTISQLKNLKLLDLDCQLGLTVADVDELHKSKSIQRVVYWGSNQKILDRLEEVGLLAPECKRKSMQIEKE